MDYKNYIESNAEVMLGKPVVKGTRITVALVLKKLSEGASADDLIAAYPKLTFESINAVLAYASLERPFFATVTTKKIRIRKLYDYTSHFIHIFLVS